MADQGELNTHEYLRDLANRLRHVPGTYDVDDYDIDRLREIAVIAEGQPPKPESDVDPMTAAEQALWAAVYSKNYEIHDAPQALVREWAENGWGDSYWNARREWEDEQALFAMERATAAVMHFRRTQGYANLDFVAHVAGR